MKWTERSIARAVARQIFERRHLVLVPNCSWPGSECDVLVVRNDLRLVDVEVKISRADLRADAKKAKWFMPWDYQRCGWNRPKDWQPDPRAWPDKIWKHYYALPEEIWKPELRDEIQPVSGVILIRTGRDDGKPYMRVERQAKPNKSAAPISAADAVDIARLASLRMWDAFDEIDQLRRADKQVAA